VADHPGHHATDLDGLVTVELDVMDVRLGGAQPAANEHVLHHQAHPVTLPAQVHHHEPVIHMAGRAVGDEAVAREDAETFQGLVQCPHAADMRRPQIGEPIE